MTLPQVVSRDEWLAARLKLLAQEKDAMRAQDAVTARRAELPMVRIDKDYVFEGPAGTASLVDLFEGRHQLLLCHFMFNPEWEEGCPSCSFTIDNVGRLEHLHAEDTTLVLVSRAPLAKIEKFRARMGWAIPWYSSAGSGFNYDFHVTNESASLRSSTTTKTRRPSNGTRRTDCTAGGQGLSVFVREDDAVFHTYSTYGRGTEFMMGTYHFLDQTPRGRRRYVNEIPYYDTYGSEAGHSHHAHH